MDFYKHSSSPFGLDISNRTLKLCELSVRGNQIKLQALSRVDVPKGIIEAGEILKPDELTKILKKMIENPQYGKVLSRNVVASLPEDKTFVKLIELGKNPNSLKEIIAAEIDKNIPIPIDEMYFDWQLISDTPDKKSILIGAAPKRTVDRYVDFLTQAGLGVEALELESVATCRALLPDNAEGTQITRAIIDIGGQGTNLIASSHGTPLFSVNVPISGDKVTEQIADSLKLDLDQAEKAKILCGLNQDKAEGIIHQLIQVQTDELIRKIKEILRFQKHHFPNIAPVSEIILSGGGANIEKLDEAVVAATSLPTVLGDVFVNLAHNRTQWHEIIEKSKELIKQYDGHLDQSRDGSTNYATAIGLALREILIKKNQR